MKYDDNISNVPVQLRLHLLAVLPVPPLHFVQLQLLLPLLELNHYFQLLCIYKAFYY